MVHQNLFHYGKKMSLSCKLLNVEKIYLLLNCWCKVVLLILYFLAVAL